MRFLLAAIVACTLSAPGFAKFHQEEDGITQNIMLEGELILYDEKNGVYAFNYAGILWYCEPDLENNKFKCYRQPR